jgi:hypothetical protein
MVGRNLRSLVMAAAILSLALGGEALGQNEWQTVTSPDGSFTVEMPPGKVFYFRDELKTAKGTPFTSHQYLVDLGDGQVTFIAQGGAYPNDLDVSHPKSILEAKINRGAEGPQGVDGGWSNVKWGAQQGAITVEALGAKGETDKRSFSALKERSFYDLDYWGPRGTATSPDVDRFFASLRIGDR